VLGVAIEAAAGSGVMGARAILDNLPR
jgi:hypothetical protein